MAYTIVQPRVIHMGVGSLCFLGGELSQRDPARILVVVDPTITQLGITERVFENMGAYRDRTEVFINPTPDPDIAIVERCAHRVRSGSFDMVIGVGGGSPMDVAKAASVAAAHDEDIRDLLGRFLLKRRGIPLILIPTTAGTGTEVTQAAVMEDPDLHSKKSIWDPRAVPDVAIVDPELVKSAPPSLTADTALDALFHGIEGCTAQTTHPVAQLYCREAIRLLSSNLRRAYEHGEDMEARDALSRAATLAGIGFSNGGLGAVHGLALALDLEPGFNHGKGLAILGPWIMNFNRIGNEALYATLARDMGEDVSGLDSDAASLLACRAAQRLAADVGIPGHLKDHDLTEGNIPIVAERAYKLSQRLMPMNIRSMTRADVHSIFEDAYDGTL